MAIFQKVLRRLNPVKYWRKKGVSIGKNTTIFTSVIFGSEPYLVKIGDNCNITDFVEFITHDGGVHVLRNIDVNYKNYDCFKGKIVIGNNVFIGNHACIMPGVVVGSNCIIGYGSVVTKNVPDNSVVAGVPARIICSITDYASKNSGSFYNTKNCSPKEKREFLQSKI